MSLERRTKQNTKEKILELKQNFNTKIKLFFNPIPDNVPLSRFRSRTFISTVMDLMGTKKLVLD